MRKNLWFIGMDLNQVPSFFCFCFQTSRGQHQRITHQFLISKKVHVFIFYVITFNSICTNIFIRFILKIIIVGGTHTHKESFIHMQWAHVLLMKFPIKSHFHFHFPIFFCCCLFPSNKKKEDEFWSEITEKKRKRKKAA